MAVALGTEPPVGEERFGAMSLVELPAAVSSPAEGLALQERLFDRHRIEVPVTAWDGRAFLRLSAQAYNAPQEYERLAAALRSILG